MEWRVCLHPCGRETRPERRVSPGLAVTLSLLIVLLKTNRWERARCQQMLNPKQSMCAVFCMLQNTTNPLCKCPARLVLSPSPLSAAPHKHSKPVTKINTSWHKDLSYTHGPHSDLNWTEPQQPGPDNVPCSASKTTNQYWFYTGDTVTFRQLLVKYLV